MVCACDGRTGGVMEHRAEKRMSHCLELRFGDPQHQNTGWTRNISRHGILVSSENRMSPVASHIQVNLRIGGETIILEGNVRWNNEFRKAFDVPENQMGLYIGEPPPKYGDYISRLG
jgi:hypothetical protein